MGRLMGQRLIKSFVSIFVSLFIFCNLAWAQNVPGQAKAGVVEKDLGEEKQPRQEPKEALFKEEKSTPDKQELQIPAGSKFVIKNFIFKGNTIFESAYLAKVVSKYRNKKLSLSELNLACDEIVAIYKKKGFFLAQAIIGPQEIVNDSLSIQIIEGNLGEVRLEGGKFYKKKFLKSHFHATKEGVVNYNSLIKSLLLLNEYPNLKLRASLEKGKTPSTVDIVIKADDKLPLRYSFDYNNFGSKYVSKYRSGVGVEYSNLAIAGDKVNMRGVAGSPMRNLGYANFEYSAPINSYDTKINYAYTWSRFDTQREFRKLDSGGLSEIYSFYFSHPLSRTLSSSLDTRLGYDYKSIKNYLLGSTSSNDQLRIVNGGFNGDINDSLFSQRFTARNFYTMMLYGGLKKIDPDQRSRVGADGHYVKTNIDVARYQRFIWDTSILLKGSFQMASDDLPVSEQIAIGGADSVRGFSVAERLGDYGRVANFEFRTPTPFIGKYKIPLLNKKLRDFMQIVGFVDYGIAYLKNTQPGEIKRRELVGAGFGLRFDLGYSSDFRIDLGFPVKGKNESTTSGDAVVYLQGTKRF